MALVLPTIHGTSPRWLNWLIISALLRKCLHAPTLTWAPLGRWSEAPSTLSWTWPRSPSPSRAAPLRRATRAPQWVDPQPLRLWARPRRRRCLTPLRAWNGGGRRHVPCAGPRRCAQCTTPPATCSSPGPRARFAPAASRGTVFECESICCCLAGVSRNTGGRCAAGLGLRPSSALHRARSAGRPAFIPGPGVPLASPRASLLAHFIYAIPCAAAAFEAAFCTASDWSSC